MYGTFHFYNSAFHYKGKIKGSYENIGAMRSLVGSIPYASQFYNRGMGRFVWTMKAKTKNEFMAMLGSAWSFTLSDGSVELGCEPAWVSVDRIAGWGDANAKVTTHIVLNDDGTGLLGCGATDFHNLDRLQPDFKAGEKIETNLKIYKNGEVYYDGDLYGREGEHKISSYTCDYSKNNIDLYSGY